MIIVAVAETGPDVPEAERAALSKAIAWFDAVPSCDLHQEKVMRLLVGCLGRPRESLQNLIDELLALQRADGGWSQTVSELRSDAFATGETLYVLSLAAYSAVRPEVSGDRVPAVHAIAGRQLADAFSIDPQRRARQCQALDPDHLRRRLLGHTGPFPTCAKRSAVLVWLNNRRAGDRAFFQQHLRDLLG